MAEKLLVVRAPSGLSGDMMLTGLARLAGLDQAGLDCVCESLGLPELRGAAKVEPRTVDAIAGWGLSLDLPHSHEHRHLSDIEAIIAGSGLTPRARELAARAFRILAEAEAHVHATSPERIHFHEVGALDSILDVCASCAAFDMLSPDGFVCGPLPVCDGTVRCAHGLLSTPAPATLKLLEGVPVYGIASRGETLTPTALSLLKALDARFGAWPPVVIDRQERVFGSRVLPGVPNGAVFVLGRSHELA
ncbi:MAG: LarC family nickel insertion protein [Thermodesulfobacteriota bacterium]